MAERDQFDDAADDLARKIRLVSAGHTDPGPWSVAAMADALRDAHARGLREGAAAGVRDERERAAAVCEAEQQRYLQRAEEVELVKMFDAARQWRSLEYAIRQCRDAILRGDDTPQPDVASRNVTGWEPGSVPYGTEGLKALDRQLQREADLLRELTPEEAEAAYEAAEPEPLSPERIDEIVKYATGQQPPAREPSKSGRHCPDADPRRAKDREAVAPAPHGPPVTADPGEGQCGPCRYYFQTVQTAPLCGWCRVARDVRLGGDARLRPVAPAEACDIGEWRAKREGGAG